MSIWDTEISVDIFFSKVPSKYISQELNRKAKSKMLKDYANYKTDKRPYRQWLHLFNQEVIEQRKAAGRDPKGRDL